MTTDKGTNGKATGAPTAVGAHWRVAGALGAAWGSLPDRTPGDGGEPGGNGPVDVIGTENLLAALADGKGDASRALAATGVTTTVVMAVLRDHHDGAAVWSGTDDADAAVSEVEVLGPDGHRGRRLSGAAVRALTHARELARARDASAFTQEDLLRGLLADGGGRAVELLAVCGTTGAEVLRRLDGEETGPADGLAPELWPTRDTLLGRRAPEGVPRWRRLLLRATRGVNLAQLPMGWVTMDAARQARADGGRVETEHLLLAALATYEVARGYPHLAFAGPARPDPRRGPAPAERFAGGAALHALGADYLTVRRGLEHHRGELGADDREVDTYTEAFEPGDGTGPLVDLLLGGETRARRLMLLLGYPV
ncbi:Clp protease N-terminal domain-containing protein [Streptomyces sp. JNUCC 64]